MQNVDRQIIIVGAGAWGTSLAVLFALNTAIDVYIVAQHEDVMYDINLHHKNSKYFDIELPKNIIAIDDIAQLKWCPNPLIVIATPAQSVRSVLAMLTLFSDPKILICAKGIENASLLLLSQVAEELVSPANIAVLCGPNFAKEIALAKPSCTVIASLDLPYAKSIAAMIEGDTFACQVSTDIKGVQIVGACKNVIAIACGLLMGCDFGENARAWLLSSAINEVRSLFALYEANIETLMGPAGIGDLILTCTSATSRNTAFGMRVAKGAKPIELISQMTAEGYYTALAIQKLAKKEGIQLPIMQAVYEVLYHDSPVKSLLKRLI